MLSVFDSHTFDEKDRAAILLETLKTAIFPSQN
jgi:hypothetical protein